VACEATAAVWPRQPQTQNLSSQPQPLTPTNWEGHRSGRGRPRGVWGGVRGPAG